MYYNVCLYRSNGFVLEGFPSSSDELRYLCSKGFYPDCTVLLQIDEQATVKRLLPNKMQIWQRKKDKRMKRKQEAYEKKFNEWVKKYMYCLIIHDNYVQI